MYERALETRHAQDPPRRPRARLDLVHRPRRNRKAEWARRLVCENVLTTNDLIWPLFLIEGNKTRIPVPPCRASNGSASTRRCARPSARSNSTFPRIAFFPYTEASLKDERGSEAFNEQQSRLQGAAARSRRNFPQLGLITDVALDPYTSHGHDGVMAGESDRERREVAALVARRSTRRARAPT